MTQSAQDVPRRPTVDRIIRPIGRHLPPSVAKALRPLGQKLAGPTAVPVAAPVIAPRPPSPPRPAPVTIPAHTPGRPPLVNWPADPPPGYRGQLDPDFQRALAARWADVQLEDCYFYHSVLLPDGSFVDGPWDLIDNEPAYLGGIALAGRRVLEFGPASGWLTLYMTREGADVVVNDIGWDLSTDLIPLQTIDLEDTRLRQVARASQVVNSWWYLKKAYGHPARAVYAPIYDLPPDLGRYDVSLFGSILLHLRDPFLALQQAAALTDDMIVVTEPLAVAPQDIDRPILSWNPTRSANPNGWWLLSPGVVTDMLDVLGFPEATVTYHTQLYQPEVDAGERAEAALYTVVARRR